MLIFKQKLPMDTLIPIKVTLPFSSAAIARKSIMKLDLQYECPVMWYQADYEMIELGGSNPDEPVSKDYIIVVIGTGHEWGDTLTQGHYIGTVLICGGSLVLHYFIVDPTDKSDKAGQEVGRMYDILEAMRQTDDEDDEDDEDDAEDDAEDDDD